MMKVARIAAAAALALSFNAGSFSVASATNNIRDICREAVEMGEFETMGACHSYINKFYTEFCKEFWDDPAYASYEWKNVGSCVSYVRHLLNELKKA